MFDSPMLRVVLVVLTLTFPSAFADDLLLPNQRTSIHDCNKRFSTTYAPVTKFLLTMPFEFPHAAAIYAVNSSFLNCVGSLISENIVLGAGYCVPNKSKEYQAKFYKKPWHDDNFIEQRLKIINFSVHPNYKINSSLYNIALMKLEKNVILNVNVIPVCLWPDKELSAKKLYIPFYQDSRIKKETLFPINTSKCATNLSFAFRHPFQRTQQGNCAEYENFDQCSESDDGQIEMRLSHDGKIVSVVVGIQCHFLQKNNIYTPIFMFRDWITATLETFGESNTATYVFNPNICVDRYKHLREHTYNYIDEWDFLTKDDFDPNKNKMPFNSHTVKLLWADELATNVSSCYGAHVEPDAIITLARCTSYLGTPPSKVLFYDLSELNIREIIVHPNYTRTAEPNYNDVAVVKLESPVKFIPTICGWYDEINLSYELGVKAVVTEKFQTDYKKSSTTLVTTLGKNQQCLAALRQRYQLPQDTLDKYLCLHYEPSSALSSYQIQLGAPIHGIKRVHYYVVGLNLVGHDTDVDTPMIGIRFSTHKAWFESVLLPSKKKQNTYMSFDALTYVDSDLRYADKCGYSDGVKGTCADISNCPSIEQRLKDSKLITFCTNSTVVCCPQQTISSAEKDLQECPQYYSHLRQERNAKSMEDSSLDKQSPHLVELGWSYPPHEFIECTGYLITTRDVITMASCLRRRDSGPNVVRFGGIWPRNGIEPTIIRIGKIEYHPMYNKTTKDHNFAIVTLVSAYEPNWRIFPGCIWLNETHFPAHQKVWVERNKRFYDIYQMYQSDCETYLKRSMADSEACMFRKQWTCASYYNPILKEASPKCVFQTKDVLLDEIDESEYKLQAPIISHQLDKTGKTIEYLMSNYDYDLKKRRWDESIEIKISTTQLVTPEKDWIVSVLERA
uniref:Peptidase S1 domain-containing protein n=1 Tax=Anopheles quadriannulatus TaxID=34691 RepID=A0A182X7W8_ANOQN